MAGESSSQAPGAIGRAMSVHSVSQSVQGGKAMSVAESQVGTGHCLCGRISRAVRTHGRASLDRALWRLTVWVACCGAAASTQALMMPISN